VIIGSFSKAYQDLGVGVSCLLFHATPLLSLYGIIYVTWPDTYQSDGVTGILYRPVSEYHVYITNTNPATP